MDYSSSEITLAVYQEKHIFLFFIKGFPTQKRAEEIAGLWVLELVAFL